MSAPLVEACSRCDKLGSVRVRVGHVFASLTIEQAEAFSGEVLEAIRVAVIERTAMADRAQLQLFKDTGVSR